MRKTAPHRRLTATGVIIALLLLAGCAPYVAAPGGTNTVNASFYNTREDFLVRLGKLKTGMAETEVLDRMGRKEDDLVRLKRDEIMMALLGTNNITFKEDTLRQEIMRSLYGYNLHYKVVEREHGFRNPIRICTDERGFDYAVTLVFREGRLFDKPIITGGVVNTSYSRTVFDFINSAALMDRAIP